MSEISQQAYDDIKDRLRRAQEVIKRKAAEEKEAVARADKAEAARVKAEADLQRTIDENPLKVENDKLRATIREGKHRAEFGRLAKERGAAEDVVDSVWKLSGYEAKGEEPNADVIGAILDEAKGKPGIAPLFAGKAEVPANGSPPPKPAPAGGQGGKGSGQSPYTLTDDDPRASDAAYQYIHFNQIAQAASERIARGEL